jgi:hypothetical protein
VIRKQVRDELALLGSSWSLYRSESGALARALLIVLALIGALSFLVLPLFVHGGQLSATAKVVLLIAMAALLVSPLSGGLMGMVLTRVREGRRGRARDVFRGYRRFLPLAFTGVLVECAVELRHAGSWQGSLVLRLLGIAAGVGLWLLLAYLVPTIVDRRLPLWASLAAAVRLLRPPELWRTLIAGALLLAASLLLEQPANLLAHRSSGLGTLYLVLLLLAWGPFTVSYLASMYVRACASHAGDTGSDHAV